VYGSVTGIVRYRTLFQLLRYSYGLPLAVGTVLNSFPVETSTTRTRTVNDIGTLRYFYFIGRTDFEYSVAFDYNRLIFNDLLFRHGHESDFCKCGDPLVISTAHDKPEYQNVRPIYLE
jgi:hypothetical protein